MSAVAAVANVASSVIGGVGAYQEGKAQNKQAQADAAAQQANGRLEAERIRKQAKLQQGAAMAAAAENGLDVNTGTPTVINDQIAQDSEQDAWMAILGSNQQANQTRADGKNAAKRGRTALAMGMLNAGASAGNSYSKWKGAKK